uniref:uncharacterized protein LOC120329670 isoform X2 n=1 Tax=Styela clava TaxID=7725 RepID=UPI0019394A4C|nr:uncharacterized protein LOC120329670 isoform X2 [Styela clava]XP_039252332.1 uncharacterized protein LOC120329670 isoform X2 [Styela clava]XP_039252333.1 uncharacterized protein LOC120329670 isoform X2 [Styela clava]XP_039252334.1 uncharacterized protein LOC120329670 isoform X2 [Styela clava]
MKICMRIVFIKLLMITWVKGEDCMLPMTCENRMVWKKAPVVSNNDACSMKYKTLEDRVNQLSSIIYSLQRQLDNANMSTAEDDDEITTQPHEYENENSPVTTYTAPATISQTNILSTTNLSLLTTIAETTRNEKVELSTNQRSCGFTYNSKCFQAIMQYAGNITFSDAEYICENKLANIYDVTQFNMMLSYMRTKTTDYWTALAVHTGMIYQGGQLKLSTGESVSLPTNVWKPGFPNKIGSHTNVAIDVYRNPDSTNQGFLNHDSNVNYYGAICEYEL